MCLIFDGWNACFLVAPFHLLKGGRRTVKNITLITLIGPTRQILPTDNVTMTIGCIISVTDTTLLVFFLLKAQKISDLRYVNTRGPAYQVVYSTGGFTIK